MSNDVKASNEHDNLVSLIDHKRARIMDLLQLFAQVKRSELSASRFGTLLTSSSIVLKAEKEEAPLHKQKETLARVLKAYMAIIRFKDTARAISAKRTAAKRVFKSMRGFVLYTKVLRLIDKRKMDKFIRANEGKVSYFNQTLAGTLAEAGFDKISFKLLKKTVNSVATRKPQIYHQNLYLELLNSQYDSSDVLAKAFSEVLAQIQLKNDSIAQITLNNTCMVILTVRNTIFVIEILKNKIVTFKSPVKMLRTFFFNEFLVILEENLTLRFMHIDFGSNKGVEDSSPITDENFEADGFLPKWKINDFKMRNSSIIVSSVCHKVSYQEDVNNAHLLPKVFKFKRKISQMSLGLNFFLAMDDSGILYSYGDNSRGQLGIGHDNPTETLSIIDSIPKQKEIIRSFSCGDKHCCATTISGKIYIWGDNSNHQLGTTNLNFMRKITKPKLLKGEVVACLSNEKRTQVQCGKNSTYILYNTKKLIYWGLINCNKLIEEPSMLELNDIFPSRVFPLNLKVEYNDNIELVYIRAADTNNTNFGCKTTTVPIMTGLFDAFTNSDQGNLISYSTLCR